LKVDHGYRTCRLYEDAPAMLGWVIVAAPRKEICAIEFGESHWRWRRASGRANGSLAGCRRGLAHKAELPRRGNGE